LVIFEKFACRVATRLSRPAAASTLHSCVLDLPLQKLTAEQFTVDLPDIQAEKFYIISVEKCDADEYDTWNYQLGSNLIPHYI